MPDTPERRRQVRESVPEYRDLLDCYMKALSSWEAERTEVERLREALISVAAARQESDDSHRWERAIQDARLMETIARDALSADADKEAGS
jgi:hypothetical protein